MGSGEERTFKWNGESLEISYRRMELFLQVTFDWKTLPKSQRGSADHVILQL